MKTCDGASAAAQALFRQDRRRFFQRVPGHTLGGGHDLMDGRGAQSSDPRQLDMDGHAGAGEYEDADAGGADGH